MRIHARVLALALLLPVGAMAQQKNAPPVSHVGPIARLLQQRADLALTADQVQKLEAIQQKSAAREQDLIARIAATRGVPPGTPLRTQLPTPEQRQAAHEKMTAVRPQLDELRQLHQQQIQEARAVLTAEQNAKAWETAGTLRHGQGGVRPGQIRHGERGGMVPRGGR